MPRSVCSYCTLIVDSDEQLNSLTIKGAVNWAKYVDIGDFLDCSNQMHHPQSKKCNFGH